MSEKIVQDAWSLRGLGKSWGHYWALPKLYWSILAKRKRLFVAAVILGIAGAIAEGVGLSLIYPLLSSVLGHEPIGGRLWSYVYSIAGQLSSNTVTEGLIYLLAALFFVKAFLLLASAGATALLVGRLREDWSQAVLSSYLHGPYADIVAEPRGRIMQRVAGETVRASRGIEQAINLFVQAIFAGVMVATLVLLNWKVMLSITIVLLLLVFGLNASLLGIMRKLAKQRLAADQKLMAATAEPVFGAEVAKLLGLEDSLTLRLRKPLRRLAMNGVLQAVIKRGPTSFVEFVIVAGVAIVLAVMWHVFAMPFEQALPIIGTFALISARLLMVLASLLNKRLDLATIVPSLAIVRAALEKAGELRRSREGVYLRSVESDVELRGVAFRYNADQEVFKNLNMVIPRGKVTALIGPSGVGKSTLGYLIARLFEPDAGEICINGRNIQDFSVASLRARIGYVEQTPVIFNGTFSENIRLGASDASDEAIEAAAVAAGIHDFITSLPKGYDSAIEDQGATLSGGQRQRLALARALVRRPDLYIIDEGTSALDRAAETVVLDTMRKVANSATVLLITHRVASTERADVIYELMRGNAMLREFHEVA